MCDARSNPDTMPADYGDDEEDDMLPDSTSVHTDTLPADYGDDGKEDGDMLPDSTSALADTLPPDSGNDEDEARLPSDDDHLPEDRESLSSCTTHKVHRSDAVSVRSRSKSRGSSSRMRDPARSRTALDDSRSASVVSTSSSHRAQKSADFTDLRTIIPDPRAVYAASASSTDHMQPTWRTERSVIRGAATRNSFSSVPARLAFECAPQSLVFLADTWNHGLGASGTMRPQTTPHPYLLLPRMPRAAGFRDGPYPYALFNHPMALAHADLFCGPFCVIADTCNHAIRMLDVRTARVLTIAGGMQAGFRDGAALMALFNQPFGCALDVMTGCTVVYIADTYNHCIRRLCVGTAHVTTLAGVPSAPESGGFNDGDAINAHFSAPTALAVSGDTIFVADSANHRIRAVHMKNGRCEVLTVGGTGARGRADGDLLDATFNYPMGLALDRNAKMLYVADSMNHCVRRINLEARIVETLAWQGYAFGKPTNVIVAGEHIYVKDEDNRRYQCLRIDDAMLIPVVDETGSAPSQEVDTGHSSSSSSRSSSHSRKRVCGTKRKESRWRMSRQKRSRRDRSSSSRGSTVKSHAADTQATDVALSSLTATKAPNGPPYVKAVSGRKNMTKLLYDESFSKEADEKVLRVNARRTKEEEFRAMLEEEFDGQDPHPIDADAEREAKETLPFHQACTGNVNDTKATRRTQVPGERSLQEINSNAWTEEESCSFLKKEFDEEDRSRQTAETPNSGARDVTKVAKEELSSEEDDSFSRTEDRDRSRRSTTSCAADNDYLSE